MREPDLNKGSADNTETRMRDEAAVVTLTFSWPIYEGEKVVYHTLKDLWDNDVFDYICSIFKNNQKPDGMWDLKLHVCFCIYSKT